MLEMTEKIEQMDEELGQMKREEEKEEKAQMDETLALMKREASNSQKSSTKWQMSPVLYMWLFIYSKYTEALTFQTFQNVAQENEAHAQLEREQEGLLITEEKEEEEARFSEERHRDDEMLEKELRCVANVLLMCC